MINSNDLIFFDVSDLYQIRKLLEIELMFPKFLSIDWLIEKAEYGEWEGIWW